MRKQNICFKVCLAWVLCLFLPVVAAAAGGGAVKMVTYFPVPYAAYNTVFVGTKFDVGTDSTRGFDLNLGDSNCKTGGVPNPSLSTGTEGDIVLRKHSTGSGAILTLGTDLNTQEASFGQSAPTSSPYPKSALTFSNLRIHKLTSIAPPLGHRVKELTTSSADVQGKVSLLPDSFISADAAALPACLDPNDSSTPLTVSWKSLKMGDTTNNIEYEFLVCGDAEACGGKDATLRNQCELSKNNPNVPGNWRTTPDCECTCDLISHSHSTSDGRCVCDTGYSWFKDPTKSDPECKATCEWKWVDTGDTVSGEPLAAITSREACEEAAAQPFQSSNSPTSHYPCNEVNAGARSVNQVIYYTGPGYPLCSRDYDSYICKCQ